MFSIFDVCSTDFVALNQNDFEIFNIVFFIVWEAGHTLFSMFQPSNRIAAVRFKPLAQPIKRGTNVAEFCIN